MRPYFRGLIFAYGGKGRPKRVRFAGERGGTITKSAKFVTKVDQRTLLFKAHYL